MLMGSVGGWTMARRTWFGWCEDSARTKGLVSVLTVFKLREILKARSSVKRVCKVALT